MGSCDRTQTRRTIYTPRKDLRVVATGVTRTPEIRQRTPRERLHPPLEKPLRRAILLHQKERRKVTTSTGLPTLKRVDNPQPLPATSHSPINQPSKDEETVHQVRRSLGLQQCAYQRRRRMEGCLYHK